MEGKFQDHNMIHLKKFNDNESRGKGPEIFFLNYLSFEISKIQKVLASQILFL